MKAKVSRGSGFRGALNYIFDVGPKATHNKNAEQVGGNMGGQNPQQMAQEFSVVRKLRPDIAKPVWHCSLALPKGERLTAEKWSEVAEDFMTRMGFDPNKPYVAVRHQDTDHDHIHIVASRIGLDGKVWLGQWEARKAIEATQALERDHGLTITPGLGDVRAERKQLTDREINMAVRTGDEPPRQQLQRLVDEAVKDKPTAPQFAERLQLAGVKVFANLASTGKMNGFSFVLGGITFSGSQLGDKYKWSSLQKRGVSYEADRDRSLLNQFRRAPISIKSDDTPNGMKGEYSCNLIKFLNRQIKPDGIEYRWQNGAPALHDFGDRVEIQGKVSPAKIKAMIELAIDKGWKNIEFTGDAAFKEAAAIEATRRGLIVSNQELIEVAKNEQARLGEKDGRGRHGTSTGSDSGGSTVAEKHRSLDASGADSGDGAVASTTADADRGDQGAIPNVRGIKDERSNEFESGRIIRGQSKNASGPDQITGVERIVDAVVDRHEEREDGHDPRFSPIKSEQPGHEKLDIEDAEDADDDVGDGKLVSAQSGSGDDHPVGEEMNWNAGFKKSSAARKRIKDNPVIDSKNNFATPEEIADARLIDPSDYLRSVGYEVTKDGQRHLSVRFNSDEYYRVTQKDDGHYVFCDALGNSGGDNISLVREIEPSVNFAEAVFRLTGASQAAPVQRPVALVQRSAPRLPQQTDADRTAGRAYLAARSIDQEIVEQAEKAGFLQYCGGAVLSVGRDKSGKVRSATRRAVDPADEVQKRDLSGSDKRFVPVLHGSQNVWIVEGAVDALALHTMAKRSGQPPPTVIISGGSGVRGFLEMQDIQELLTCAESVTIAREREKDQATQQKTDDQHDRQAARVRETIKDAVVTDWMPPEGCKDLAALNEQGGSCFAEENQDEDDLPSKQHLRLR